MVTSERCQCYSKWWTLQRVISTILKPDPSCSNVCTTIRSFTVYSRDNVASVDNQSATKTVVRPGGQSGLVVFTGAAYVLRVIYTARSFEPMQTRRRFAHNNFADCQIVSWFCPRPRCYVWPTSADYLDSSSNDGRYLDVAECEYLALEQWSD